MRPTLRLLLPFLLPLSAVAAGHDLSAVRYVPPVTPITGATMSYDGASFVTAATVPQPNGRQVIYGARTDPATGVTTPATPVGPFDPAEVPAPATWLAHGFLAVAPDARTLEVRDLRGGAVIRVPHVAIAPEIAANGGLILVVDRTSTAIGSITASTFRRDGSLVATADVPVFGSDDVDVDSWGSGFVVASAGRSGVHLFAIDAAGAIASDNVVTRSAVPGAVHVSVASSGGRAVVAWTAGIQFGFVASVSADGTVSPSQQLTSVSATGLTAVQVLATRMGYVVLTVYFPTLVTGALPLDASGRIIDAPSIIANAPFLAAASSGDAVAVLAGSRVTTAVLRDHGFDVRPAAPILVPAAQQNVRIASDGVDFVGAWQEFEGTSTVVMAGRVSRSGVPLDGPGVKLPFPADISSTNLGLSIARGPAGDALIVAAGSNGVRAVRWSRAAGALDAVPLLLSEDRVTGADAVWNGTRYLVVWSAFAAVGGSPANGLFGRFVGIDGSLSARIEVPELRPVTASDKYPQNPALAWDGHQFLLAVPMIPSLVCSILCPTPPPDEIRLVRLSAGGLALDSRGTSIPGVHTAARVASSGSEFLVVLDDGTYRIVTTGPGGIDVGIERRFFRPIAAYPMPSDVVWDGGTYVIGWMASVLPFGGPAWVESVRSDRSGELSAWTYVTTNWPSAVRLASNDLGETALAVSEAPAETQTSRARVHFASELQATPPAPAPPRNLVSHLFGTSALLTWESDAGAAGFVIEHAVGPAWVIAGIVDGQARQATVTPATSGPVHAGDRFRVRSFGPGGASADGPVTSIGSERRVRSARP